MRVSDGFVSSEGQPNENGFVPRFFQVADCE